MSSVVAATDQAVTDIYMVATATEQMNANINEPCRACVDLNVTKLADMVVNLREIVARFRT